MWCGVVCVVDRIETYFKETNTQRACGWVALGTALDIGIGIGIGIGVGNALDFDVGFRVSAVLLLGLAFVCDNANCR